MESARIFVQTFDSIALQSPFFNVSQNSIKSYSHYCQSSFLDFNIFRSSFKLQNFRRTIFNKRELELILTFHQSKLKTHLPKVVYQCFECFDLLEKLWFNLDSQQKNIDNLQILNLSLNHFFIPLNINEPLSHQHFPLNLYILTVCYQVLCPNQNLVHYWV